MLLICLSLRPERSLSLAMVTPFLYRFIRLRTLRVGVAARDTFLAAGFLTALGAVFLAGALAGAALVRFTVRF